MRFLRYAFFCGLVCFCVPLYAGTRTCDAGKYPGLMLCNDCPAGCFCPGGTFNNYSIALSKFRDYCSSRSYGVLDNGEINTLNTGSINLCYPNYPNSEQNAEAATDCYVVLSAGKWVATANAAPTDCPQGAYCRGGTRVYYGSTGGKTDCAAGAYNNVTGATSLSACRLCPVGTYSGAGAATCINCPAAPDGWTASTSGQGSTLAQCYAYRTPDNCKSGSVKRIYGRIGNNMANIQFGYVGTIEENEPLVANAGYYNNANKSCDACGAGYCASKDGRNCTSATGATQCLKCPRGRYSDGAANTDCAVCSGNTYTDTTGNSSCTVCSGPGRGIYNGDHTKCDVCPDGTYAVDGICETCPAGYYCSGGVMTMCETSSRKYQDLTGQSGCKVCDANKYVKTVDSAPVDCVDCSDASRYVSGVECKLCPKPSVDEYMYFSYDSYVNTSESDCKISVPKNNCQKGLRREWTDVDGNKQTVYHSGIYSYNSGQQNYVLNVSAYAVEANPNYYINTDNALLDQEVCVHCPSGLFSAGGNISENGCSVCMAGSCVASIGGEAFCRKCSAGYICPGDDNGNAQNCRIIGDDMFGMDMCPIDAFSVEGQAQCSKCAKGFTTVGSSLCNSNGMACRASDACRSKIIKFMFTRDGNEKSFQWPDWVIQSKPNNSNVTKKQ